MQNYIFYLLPGFGDKKLRPLQEKIKYQSEYIKKF